MLRYLLMFLFTLMLIACGTENTPSNSQKQGTSNGEESPNKSEKPTEMNLSEKDQVRFTDGENLFRIHCASCHQLKGELLGPALADITEKHSIEWIKKFTKNSEEMIEAGDKDAVAVYEKYDKMAMPSFENLTDEEIENIIFYITQASKTL